MQLWDDVNVIFIPANPLMYVDPNGQIFMLVTGLVGAVVGGAVGAVVSASKGEFSWKSVAVGAAIGGTIGLTGGAAASLIATGGAFASTGAVAAGFGLGSATASGGVTAKLIDWTTRNFADGKLMSHFNKHAAEWGGKITSASQYLQRARDLLNSPVGKNVQGFVSKDGWIFRYNTVLNEFAVGRPNGIISTFFKPQDGYAYWLEQIRMYGGK